MRKNLETLTIQELQTRYARLKSNPSPRKFWARDLNDTVREIRRRGEEPETPAPAEEVAPATPATPDNSFRGDIRFHVFHTERYEVVGFEVRTSLGNAPGYPIRARVSPADLAAMIRANVTILDVDVWVKDLKDGREFKTFGKRWFRKIEEGGEFVRHAVRVSSMSGTPYFEEEGFSDNREEFNGRVFICIKDTKAYGRGI